MHGSTIAAMGRAIDYFGDHRAMARALGVTPTILWRARVQGRVTRVMAEKIHKLTFGTVRSEELRPDLFPREHHHSRIQCRQQK